MITLIDQPVWLFDGTELVEADSVSEEKIKKCGIPGTDRLSDEEGRKETMTYGILKSHSTGSGGDFHITFDSLISHDLTYVGIIQTARASGLKEFPLPYVLTSCHNSLCAVGGTINRDDHWFGMSACQKYGGIFVPANQSIIHSYAREMLSGCGRMVLGSDSHTRYGALGTMGIGEGGGELVKQLLNKTYDISMPKVVAVYLTGTPKAGIGPQDIALSLVGAVFRNGFVKNAVLEFVGPGIHGLSMDMRNGIDVMTTETACLSSVWCTDEKTERYFAVHGRPEAYHPMQPGRAACYDRAIVMDLSCAESMVALPFHPSNVVSIRELNENMMDILAHTEEEANKQIENPALYLDLRSKVKNGRLKVDQAEIAGCSGGSFENIVHAARILEKGSLPEEFFPFSIYPASNPVLLELEKNHTAEMLIREGVILKPAFCGPCFGAGDVPANGALSLQHTTRNFPNREGSKPKDGQMASVALADARTIAATAINGGYLTAATEIGFDSSEPEYHFDDSSYRRTVYQGFGKADPSCSLRFGPNIADWPQMIPMADRILMKVSSVITDPVTTTDELLPSGDASSYRSNPEKMSAFTLSRRDPGYVPSAKSLRELESLRRKGEISEELEDLAEACIGQMKLHLTAEKFLAETELGSCICTMKPGDGSAREQAASCQRVLGGIANICVDYATRRYRSNVINWGMIPFTAEKEIIESLGREEYILIEGIQKILEEGAESVTGTVLCEGKEPREIPLQIPEMTEEERKIILAGGLINYYAEDSSNEEGRCRK